MAEFKDRLNYALELREITPAELCRRTGIGDGAMSQYRKGAYKATQRNLELMARALNVSIAWLMGVSDDMKPSEDQQKQEIIQLFESLPDDTQQLALSLLRQLADKAK